MQQSNIVKLLLVSRPISWVNTAYPFGLAYILAGGEDPVVFIIGVLFFLIPYNLMMYGINDIFDYESDIRNPRKGGIEGMKEQRALHPLIAKAVVISSLPFIVYLLLQGSLIAKSSLLIVIFFVVAYSIAVLRFKERPFLDSVTSSIHFVGPAIYALLLVGFPQESWPYIIAFFFWGMASHAFGAIQDIIPDREGGISSIATVLGARKTIYIVIALYTAAAVILAMQPMPFAILSLIGILYIANVARLITITDQTSSIANRPWRRFIWLNLIAGFAVTMVVLWHFVLK
jgi:4-hydroxybenzoate polyprenyltransferase